MKDLKSLRSLAPGFARKMAPVYQLLDWRWGPEIPDEAQIEKQVYALIDDLEKRGHENPGGNYISTGGIVIRYNDKGNLWELIFNMYYDE